MSKIDAEELRIEKLRKEHDISGFQCYERELVQFLQEDALEQYDKKLSVTFLCFLEETNELVGYISLRNDRIDLIGNLKYYFHQKGVNYKSLPALKIGKLAVDNGFLRKGIGTLLVAFAYEKAKHISEQLSGCRFLTVDAKRNIDASKDSINFYEKLSFKTLKERKQGSTPMYLDLLQR